MKHLTNRKKQTLQAEIKEHVAEGAELMTDELAETLSNVGGKRLMYKELIGQCAPIAATA